HLDVVVGARAGRHAFVQEVRDAREEVVELRRERREPRFAGGERVAERVDLALQRLDVRARGFRAADGLRALVALLAEAFDADLQVLALGLERLVARAVERESAARQVRDDAVQVLTQQLWIEHTGVFGEFSLSARAHGARSAGTSLRAPWPSARDRSVCLNRWRQCRASRTSASTSGPAARRGRSRRRTA